MNENYCDAHDCNNVIRGRRNDAKYCTESCKQRQKRYNKTNGISGVHTSMPKIAVSTTGNLISDMSNNAAVGLFRNGAADPMTTVTSSAMATCVPYAIEAIKQRPLLSLLFAVGGFALAGKVFNTCTTSTTVRGDKNEVTKTCKKATSLQKSGSAAVLVLAGNYILDNLNVSNPSNIGTSDTGQTRVRHGSYPPIRRTRTKPVVEFSAS